jgi:hypothetical protein
LTVFAHSNIYNTDSILLAVKGTGLREVKPFSSAFLPSYHLFSAARRHSPHQDHDLGQSRVVFIAQTPLLWESVEHDSLDFIRFTDSPVTDSVGYPELPMITCLIAMPDSVTPELDFAWAGMHERHVDPVYPAPAQVISYEYTPAVVDSFVQDSTAYISASLWPAEMVRVIGEMRICGQRLLKVQLFPARYLASDSTLVTVSSISASLSFDSTEAVWSSTGLGAFQDLMDDSPIVGYHRISRSLTPTPTYFGQVDPYTGPLRMPDYVIICASGLFDQCQEAIDDLAEHRVDLNDFDVALVTTDDILDDFGGPGQLAITDVTIRAFTEHMWNNWTQTPGEKPEYLLLIGDHEESSYSGEPWFLPTHEYLYSSEEDLLIGNDEWYVYFNELQSVDNAMPSMFVGRLSVKNGNEHAPDTLSVLIQNLIDLEQPITNPPMTDYRRRVLRLAGTGKIYPNDYHQTFGIDNKPLSPWTEAFADWMSYDYVSHYCGDGRWFTDQDLSEMKSSEWVENCLTEFSRGAGVAFYTNHGDLHMFSAGLEWCPWLYEFGDTGDQTKGSRDSTFNNYQIEQHLTGTVQDYAAPFELLLCCSAGTFNHTLNQHENRESHPYFCFDDDSETMPFNFSSDCLAERMLKNTDVPVAGVFCGSQSSCMGCYEWYGKGILEAIYAYGHGRLGDAISSARVQYIDQFIDSNGEGSAILGQFNLLGDPALDISDRVRYPDNCDLSVYGDEITVSQYPEEISTGLNLPLVFRVRNNGAQDSDECNIRITFRNDVNTFTDYIECDPIEPGGFLDVQYTWDCSRWFQPPMDLTISVEADYEEVCDDCWWPNNEASVTVGFNDTYPVLGGWIQLVDEVASTTPVLANIDNDLDLEVIVLVGNTLTAFEEDGGRIWSVFGEGFSSSIQILASDLGNDGKTEFILASDDGIKVVSAEGDVLQTIQLATGVFCIGAMESTQGLELCAALSNTLYLYTWNSQSQSFISNSTKQLGLPNVPIEYSLACADLDNNSYADAVYGCGYASFSPPWIGYNALVVYDWEAGGTPFLHTRSEPGLSVTPAAGRLGGEDLVGIPYGIYEYLSDNPALIVEPDGIIEEECEAGTCDADNLRYGVFADWDPLVPGADTFVLPSEMQALAWGNDGLLLNDWPTGEFSGASISSPISPTALGNIDNAGYADVLFSTLLDGKCILLAYESSSNPPANSDFPITLPDNVTSYGGFSIADIDRDGVVEMVFGTSDGRLHCWELGTCTSGYAPWPQFQHDEGRTGVLQ